MGLDHLLSVIRLSTLTPHMIRAINMESIHNYGWCKRRGLNLRRSITIQNTDAVNHHIEPCFRVWNEPGQIVQAMAMDEPGFSQINCLSTLRIKDAPLLFLNSNRPVLNKQVFGDLTCLSVARMSCGRVEHLGSLHLTPLRHSQPDEELISRCRPRCCTCGSRRSAVPHGLAWLRVLCRCAIRALRGHLRPSRLVPRCGRDIQLRGISGGSSPGR